MKQLFAIVASTLLTFPAFTQTLRLDSTSIQFKLPNNKWSLPSKDIRENLQVYYYKREPIPDSQNRQVIPNISFIVEEHHGLNVIEYSIAKRSKFSMDVQKVLSHDMDAPLFGCQNAIGYLATYTDKSGIPHTVYVVHIINGDKGIQLIMDITSELFDKYEKEFLTTLKSISE